jgi:hypothetical protein
MTSAAQVQANRANAQKSTGPRTAEGKAVAAQNAVRHGLLAKEVVVKGEDPAEFELYRDQMLEELAPAGQMESMLAHRIVGLSWRLRRAERLQAAAFDKVEDQSKPPELVLSPEQASRLLAVLAETGVQPPEPVAAGPAVGRRAVQDFAQERVLDRLLVYERRIESSLYRTMGEFRKQRLLRAENPPTGEVTTGTALAGGEPVRDQRFPVSDEVGRGRPTYQEPPDGGTTNGAEAQGQACETNPISGGVSSLTCEVSSEQGQAPNPPASNLTLPTSDSAIPTCGSGIRPGDELPAGVATNVPQVPELSCETNPISAGSNAGGTPNGTGGQEPSCETNPISGAAKKDPVSYVHIFHRRR